MAVPVVSPLASGLMQLRFYGNPYVIPAHEAIRQADFGDKNILLDEEMPQMPFGTPPFNSFFSYPVKEDT